MAANEIAGFVGIALAILVPPVACCLSRMQQRREKEALRAIYDRARQAAIDAQIADLILRPSSVPRSTLDAAIVYGPATAKARQIERIEEERRERLARPKRPVYTSDSDAPVAWV